MGKNYATSHQGLAAYFVMRGEKVVDIQKKKMNIKGNKVERPVFTFYMGFDEGKKLAEEYFNKTATVEPCEFYATITDLRSKVFSLAKKAEAPTTEEVATV